MKISASILAADFARLGEEIKRVENAGIPMLHVDVMDGLFVPNISLGIPVLKSIDKVSDLFMDVHLMIQDPIRYVDDFFAAGADRITFHLESDSNAFDCIKKIRDLGIQVGISIKPNTPAESLQPYLKLIDVVLIMSVEPGFGGQKFQDGALQKLGWLSKNWPQGILEVDGGIAEQTGKLAVKAGAQELVAGTYLFGAKDMKKAAEALQAD